MSDIWKSASRPITEWPVSANCEKNFIFVTQYAIQGVQMTVLQQDAQVDVVHLYIQWLYQQVEFPLLSRRQIIFYMCTQHYEPVKEDVIRLDKNDARMIRWTGNVRHEDRIPAEELRTRLKLESMR